MATPMVFHLSGAVVADRYEVGRARGDSRLTYDAIDQRGGTPVTLTMLLDAPVRDPAAFGRLQGLAHPHVARVLDAGRHDNDGFVVWEGGDGYDLHDELRGGPIAAARILAIVAAVCDGVAALHARELCHGALDVNAVYVGHPRSADDTDVGEVKLVNIQLALGKPPGTVAGDLSACRALLRVLAERDPIAPLRALIEADVASVAELAQRCRAVELSAADRAATATRPPPEPVPPFPVDVPMPTNWSPPPPPRDFAYRPATVPTAVAVVRKPMPWWPFAVAALVAIALAIVWMLR